MRLIAAAQVDMLAIHRHGAVDDAHVAAHEHLHGRKLSIGQHGALQLQQIELVGGLVQHVAQIAQPRLQRHHPGFAQAVDRWIGDLAERLAEVVVQPAIALGQHGQRRVVAHGTDGLGRFLHHRVQDELQLLERGANGQLAAAEFLADVQRGLRGIGLDDAVDLGDAPGPCGVVVPRGQHVLHLLVAIERAGFEVDGDGLARPHPALGTDVAFVELHHAGFGSDHQQAGMG